MSNIIIIQGKRKHRGGALKGRNPRGRRRKESRKASKKKSWLIRSLKGGVRMKCYAIHMFGTVLSVLYTLSRFILLIQTILSILVPNFR